jgi:hypothetical protein
VKKAKKAEDLAKRRREAKKAGLPEPESSEASVLEIEGRKEPHWLNEIMEEEEEEELPIGGGRRHLAGSHKFLGVQRAPAILSLRRVGTKSPRWVR